MNVPYKLKVFGSKSLVKISISPLCDHALSVERGNELDSLIDNYNTIVIDFSKNEVIRTLWLNCFNDMNFRARREGKRVFFLKTNESILKKAEEIKILKYLKPYLIANIKEIGKI